MKPIRPGDVVPGDVVRAVMFDARRVQGTVCLGGNIETCSGAKIRFRSGGEVFLVNLGQIKKLVRRRFNVFLRQPGLTKKWYVSRRVTYADADALVRNYNSSHSGPKRAEFEEA